MEVAGVCCFTYGAIEFAALEGGATSGASVARKTVLKGAVAVANNIVDYKIDERTGEGTLSVESNPLNVAKNTALDQLASAAGSPMVKPVQKLMGGKNDTGVVKTVKQVAAATGYDINRAGNKTLKTVAKKATDQATKQASATVINTVKVSTN